MYNFSTAQKEILKLAYDNLNQNHTREYSLIIKNSSKSYLINALRSLNESGYIEAISDNFYDDVVSFPPVYKFTLTDEGVFAAESL